MSIVGGCWKLTIIRELLDRTLRYGELRRAVGDVTDRVLTRQLRELEDDGLIHREVYAEVPPRVEYSLTPMGETLRALVRDLDAWGQTWVAAQKAAAPQTQVASRYRPAQAGSTTNRRSGTPRRKRRSAGVRR